MNESFEDFGMIDTSTARAREGLGLGLGLSRRIAEAMGGTLDMFSDGTTSSTVRLTTPIAPPAGVERESSEKVLQA